MSELGREFKVVDRVGRVGSGGGRRLCRDLGRRRRGSGGGAWSEIGRKVRIPRGEQVSPYPSGELGVPSRGRPLPLGNLWQVLPDRNGVIEPDPGSFPLFTHLLHIVPDDPFSFPLAESDAHLVLGEGEKVGEELGLVRLGERGAAPSEGGRVGQRTETR